MEYLLHILVIASIYIILSLSLNIILGFTGLPAFGHAAFYCVGAYTSALIGIQYGIPAWIGLIIGGLVATVLGIVISYPTLRLKGDYLAIATFGLGVIIYSIAQNWTSLTKGPLGLPGIPQFSMFGFVITHRWQYLLLAILLVYFTYFILNRIVSSPFGRILRGIRDDEIATQTLGKNTNLHKIQVFAIGSFFAGISGSLYAHYITFIDPSSFTIMESILVVLMVVFGGMGSLKGSVIGAAILVIFPELLRFIGLPSYIAAPIRQMIYGLLLIVLMLYRPRGILGRYKWK